MASNLDAVSWRGTPLVMLVALSLAAAACGADAQPAREPETSTMPDSTAPATDAVTVPAATAPATTATLPSGLLVAVLARGRDDVVEARFQVRIVNGTDEELHLTGVQFVWEGFSTPEVPRDDTVVAGQRVDFPVPFTGAICPGEAAGVAEPPDPPDPATAIVRLRLGDDVRDLPVYDLDGVATTMWVDDCERQFVEAAVHIEWTAVREGTHDGRPVTLADLHVTRLAAQGEIVIRDVGDTIPFRVETAASEGEPLLRLPADADVGVVPVRIVEARCDAHAVAEAKQPFRFVVRLELGDGVERTLVVEPPDDAKEPMRATALAACTILGEAGALD